MRVKKCLIGCLAMLLAVLLASPAFAEEGHTWVWTIWGTGGTNEHVKVCWGKNDGHPDKVVTDHSTRGEHAFVVNVVGPELNLKYYDKLLPISVKISVTCSVCGIDFTNFYPSDITLRGAGGKMSTCTEQGWATFFDTLVPKSSSWPTLRAEITYPVSPLDEHRYGAYEPDQAATCTQDATETARCTHVHDPAGRCEATDTRPIAGTKLEHIYVPHEGKDPTCTETGWDAYVTCGRDGCTYTTRGEDLPIDPDNHDLEPHEGKEPTCTEAGWNAYEACKNCDYTTRVSIAALDHDLEPHEGKEPTCTETGWDAYKTCKRQGCTYTTRGEDIPIDPDNHDLEPHEGKEPTCTEIGWNAYETCKNCDYTTRGEDIPIDPDNHDLEQHEGKEPTCTEIGWDAYEACKREGCGYTTRGADIPMLYHRYGEWSPGGEKTHRAACMRSDCRYVTAGNCTVFSYILPAEEGTDAKELNLCPVCGETDEGTRLELIEKAYAIAWVRELPAGELVARMGTLESGETLLSVSFEDNGHPTQATGVVKLLLPAEALEGNTLYLLTAEGEETELPFTTEGENAILMLDFSTAESPVMLLHLTAT